MNTNPTLSRSRLTRLRGTVADWLASLEPTTEIARLLRRPDEERRARGYEHTLRKICQQPVTWIETASALASDSARLRGVLESAGILRVRGTIILTGSGSSLYAGECLALPLQEALGVSVQAVPAGTLLTHPHGSVPPVDPYLVVSFARSGNSPESRAVVDSLLERDDRGRHLIITCNRGGALVTGLASHPRVDSVVLDEKTDDKSLVMTSSFTNMVLAGRFLAWTGAPGEALAQFEATAEAAAALIERDSDDLARVARSGFRRAVYLGSGCRMGSAHEAGLKMLEMTAGRIPSLSESFLGLRHGPMWVIHPDTVIVAFLSSDPVVRAYEVDLLREVDRKELGARKVVVGSDLPADLPAREGDRLVECGPGLADADLAVLDVLVGQILAFHACIEEGLKPDTPSTAGVINRVVERFTIQQASLIPFGADPRSLVKKVLVAGELNVDIVLQGYSAFPEPGKEVLVDDFAMVLGSASAICAMGLARLGREVAFLSVVGADPWGRYCLDRLRERGIDVSRVHSPESLKTGVTVALTSARDRALVSFLGSIAALRGSDVSDAALTGFQHLHVSSYFLQTGLRPDLADVFARARRRGLTTSLDPGFDPSETWGDDLRRTLIEVDVFLPNEIELRGLTGTDDPERGLRSLENGRTRVVAKLGREGACTLDEGRLVRVPAYPVEPLDTTGAGDSFDAGFLHAWLDGAPVLGALRLGAACGALSTLGLGGTARQADRAQAEDLMKKAPDRAP